MAENRWTITGTDDLATKLRDAATVIPVSRPITIATEINADTGESTGTGPAILDPQAHRLISTFFGFRVLEDVARRVESGDVGLIYGVYGSVRVPPDEKSKLELTLADTLAYIMEATSQPVERVMTYRRSLVQNDDAYFATLRLSDSTIVTLEVMLGDSSETLIEVTGSVAVLRAEPHRQSVRLSRNDGPETSLPWHEDEAERLLGYVASSLDTGIAGDRFRQVWNAILESIESGRAITL